MYKMTDYLYEIGLAFVGAIVSAIGYLIRTVLTNKTEIELLKSEIEARDKRRDEDRQLMMEFRSEVKSSIETIKSEIIDLWKTK